MAIDFFGVTLEGRIHTFPGGNVRGRVIELWVDEDQGTEITPDLNALAYVSEVRVEHRLGMNSKIQLVLTPPFEDGLRLLNSEIIHFGVGRLEVTIGYTTGSNDGAASAKMPRLPFVGLLQKPDVQMGGEEISITLNALGVGYAMNITAGTEVETFEPGISFADAVKQILQKYANDGDDRKSGIDISDLYSHFTEEDKDPVRGHKFFRVPPELPSSRRNMGRRDLGPLGETGDEEEGEGDIIIQRGPRNDWWFVTEIVRKFDLDFFVLGDKLIISSNERWMQNIGRNSARKHFVLRGNVDPNRNIYPILTFNSPTTAVWLQPGVGQVAAEDIDDDKETEGRVEANARNTEQTRTRDGAVDVSAVTPVADVPQDAGRNLPGNPHDAAVHEEVRSEWERLQMQAGITAEVSTIGIPNLTPGEVVQISGFQRYGVDRGAALFEGNYGVLEVTHSVGTSGYETNFRCLSNFIPRQFANALENMSNVVPEEEPDDSDDDSVPTNPVDDEEDLEGFDPDEFEG